MSTRSAPCVSLALLATVLAVIPARTVAGAPAKGPAARIDPVTGLPQNGDIGSPGNAPSVIMVGATKTAATALRRDDTVPGYSSKGPTWFDALAKPDLVAPGFRIVSTSVRTSALYRDHADWRFATPYGAGGGYLRLSGSSMSTAVVSGVVPANARDVVWGNAIVSANLKNVVWGNDDMSANARNVVWGDARNVVWGNSCNVEELCY